MAIHRVLIYLGFLRLVSEETLFPIGLFSIKFFFVALPNLSEILSFYLAKFVCESKISSKVKAFAWLVADKRINTNVMLYLRIPYKALRPKTCILCLKRETVGSTFLHYAVTIRLCTICLERLGWSGCHL